MFQLSFQCLLAFIIPVPVKNYNHSGQKGQKFHTISILYDLNAPGRVYSACKASRLAQTQPAGASWAGRCSRMPLMCHSIWLKICFAAGRASGAAVPVSTPMACRRARTSPAARASPSHSTGCHSPASRPFAGRCCKKKARRAFQQGQCHRLQSAGLWRCFGGSSNAVPAARAAAQVGERAFFRTGAHRSARRPVPQLHKGLIVVAGRIRRLVLHHSGGERFFTAGSVTAAGSLDKRENTRSTLPSTAGTGMPKLMDATAPAV